MGEPISTKKLGGVTYNANQFTGEQLKNGKFKLTAKKTGETLIFSQQPKGIRQEEGVYSSNDYIENGVRMRTLRPEVTMGINKGLLYDDNNFTLTDIMGATFSSSKEAISNVKLRGCQNTYVNLSVNKSRWFGDSADIKEGHGNRVRLDKEDNAYINAAYVEGAGVADQKDYE